MAPARRSGFDAWLHTFPQLRWKPRIHSRRRTFIRVRYYHWSIAAIVAIAQLYAAFFTVMAVFVIWAAPLAVWMYEVMFWSVIWGYYSMFLGARWIYRRNIIGQTIRTVTGRRTVHVPYDPHGAPARPIDLATLGDPDPYDTDRPRTRS